MYEYKIKPGTWRVVDGDTVDLDIDLGFNITTRIRGRLGGVDTPERGHQDFHFATGKLVAHMMRLQEDDTMRVWTEKTGKYGRWIVWLDGDVNAEMAKEWPYE